MSESRKLDEKLYAQARKEYLKDNPESERCKLKPSSEIHHKAGKVSSLLYDKRYFMAVDRACHIWIKNNVIESKKLGYSVTRLGKK